MKREPTGKSPGRPPTSEVAAGERRSQILHVAGDRFSRFGYGGASIGDIARETGISKASLLHHFGSKEALYAETMRNTLDQIAMGIRFTIAEAVALPEQLVRLADVAIVALQGEGDLGGWLRDAEEHLSPHELTSVRASHARMMHEVEVAMREGIARGELASGDPRFLAHAFWVLLEGFGGREGIAAGFQGKHETAQAVVDLFLHGATSSFPQAPA